MTDSKKLDVILSKMDNVEELIREVKSEIKETKEQIGSVESRLEEKIDSVENDVKSIKLTMENEIKVNIKRIAEGHLDISRHIHDVIDAKEEMEMLTIRVNMLETEVRELNRKIS